MSDVVFHSTEYETYCHYEFTGLSTFKDFCETLVLPRYGLFDDEQDLYENKIFIEFIGEPKLEDLSEKIKISWNDICNELGDLEYAFNCLRSLLLMCKTNMGSFDYMEVFYKYDNVLEMADKIERKCYTLLTNVRTFEALSKYTEKEDWENRLYHNLKSIGSYVHTNLNGMFLKQGYFCPMVLT